MSTIEFLQQFDHPTIYTLMRLFSILGDEPFYLLVLPILFWCWDTRKAVPLAAILLLNIYLNFVLKDIFSLPRPEGVALIDSYGYGFPSGHAQSAVVLWGYLAWVVRRNLGLAGILIFLIGLSRVYLGVHFLSDVVGGWTIGLVWLFCSLYVVEHLKKRKLSIPTIPAVGLVFLISLWIASFYTTEMAMKISGAMFGLLSGAALERSVLRFSPQNSIMKQGIKILLGVIGVVLIKEGLDVLFPQVAVFNYIRYAAIGVWISLGAPWMFIITGLGKLEVVRDKYDQN